MLVVFAVAWSAFLVPALLLSIIVEAAIGAIPRFFLTIPAVVIGGYYGAFAYQRVAITMTEAELQASNPKFVTPFDPVIQSLVFEHGARKFAEDHKIPVVYESLHHSFNAYRLLPNSDCRVLNAARHVRRHYWIQFRNWNERDAELTEPCMLTTLDEEPSGTPVSIKLEPYKYRRFRFIPSTGRLLLRVGGVVEASYGVGIVDRLPALPFLFAGCGWDDCGFWLNTEIYRLKHAAKEVDPARFDTPASIMLGIEKLTNSDVETLRHAPRSSQILNRYIADGLTDRN
jgi:hypothetical protein